VRCLPERPIPGGFNSEPISRIMGRQRPQKITFGETRESGVRGVLIYCSDYHWSHRITASAVPGRITLAVRS
jgi:hypothetical protein